MRKLIASAAWTILLSLAAADVSAQSFQGGLRGTVKDPQGVIPGVTVILTNEQTNVSRDTITNSAGEYSFPAVDPATYTVRAAVTGFKKFERKGVPIGTQQFFTLDITLEVGAIEESITVIGESPLIETSNASVGDVLDRKTLELLPSVGKNAFLLSITVPTVVSSGDTHWNRMQDQTGASALSLGGGPVRGNNYLLDGFPITDLQNRSSTNPSIEMLEDVKVQVHTYDAEMGQTGGGVFNATAKSGTNSFHGTGYFQDRPNSLIGPNFFGKIAGLPAPNQYWRNGGGGFGGPIVRDKTFFWFAGEMYRDGLTQNGNLHFPTAAERAGDFSNFTDSSGRQIPIYDPLSTNPTTGQRTQFPGNIIPPNRINPVGAKIVSYLPIPNISPAVDNGNNNYAALDVIKDSAQQASFKADHHFNDKIALSGTYLYQITHEPQNNFFPDARFAAPSYQLDRDIRVVVLNNTYIVSPSTVLTLRYGMNTFNDNNNLPFDFDTHTLGWNKAFSDAIAVQKFPTFSFTSFSGTGFSGKADRHYYSQGVNGALTKLAGEHSFKIGGGFRLLGVRSLSLGASAGSYTFNGQFTRITGTSNTSTGNAIADLMLGFPSSGSITQVTQVDDYVRGYGGFIQDDWRVNSRLTVNYGIRLEHGIPLTEKGNHLIVGFDKDSVSPLNVTIPASVDPLNPVARQVKGGLIYAGVNGAQTHWGNPPTIQASPRAGAVLKINENTVVRGGYGMFWAPTNGAASNPTGFSATTTLSQVTGIPITSIDNPFPGGLIQPTGNALGLASGASSSVSFVDPNWTPPRVQQYSADFQRELPGNMSVTVGYTGATGTHLDYGTSVSLNQIPAQYASLGTRLTSSVPNPFFGNALAGSLAALQNVPLNWLLVPYPQYGLNNVNMTTSGASSQYHALILQLRKRVAGWWGGNFNYTYSRLRDNQIGSSNYYSSAPGIVDNYNYIPGSSIYNPTIDYGLSLLDQPHKVVLAPIVRLPFGKDRKFLNNGGPLEYLVGGWSISAVATMQSGFPIGVTQTNTLNLNGAGQRPNAGQGTDFVVPGSITDRLIANFNDNLYLNPAAFSLAPSFTFGNAPRILPGVRSPMRNTTDLALNKEFRTGASTRATLRVEVINLFNNPWYAALQSTSVGNSNFGRVNTQGNYSRLEQITLRFQF
jgi:hypothetical protein